MSTISTQSTATPVYRNTTWMPVISQEIAYTPWGQPVLVPVTRYVPTARVRASVSPPVVVPATAAPTTPAPALSLTEPPSTVVRHVIEKVPSSPPKRSRLTAEEDQAVQKGLTRWFPNPGAGNITALDQLLASPVKNAVAWGSISSIFLGALGTFFGGFVFYPAFNAQCQEMKRAIDHAKANNKSVEDLVKLTERWANAEKKLMSTVWKGAFLYVGIPALIVGAVGAGIWCYSKRKQANENVLDVMLRVPNATRRDLILDDGFQKDYDMQMREAELAVAAMGATGKH